MVWEKLTDKIIFLLDAWCDKVKCLKHAIILDLSRTKLIICFWSTFPSELTRPPGFFLIEPQHKFMTFIMHCMIFQFFIHIY